MGRKQTHAVTEERHDRMFTSRSILQRHLRQLKFMTARMRPIPTALSDLGTALKTSAVALTRNRSTASSDGGFSACSSIGRINARADALRKAAMAAADAA